MLDSYEMHLNLLLIEHSRHDARRFPQKLTRSAVVLAPGVVTSLVSVFTWKIALLTVSDTFFS